MADPEQPKPQEKDRKGGQSRRGSSWRSVESKIWTRRSESKGLRGVFSNSIMHLAGLLGSTTFILFVAAPIGGLGAYLSFLLAYDLGGLNMFGAYLVGIWSVVGMGIVAVLEKSGYSRNFRSWDIPLQRLLVAPIVFLAVIGLVVLTLYLRGVLH